MSFSGDLEHFPLVDVIQMLHMTAKTGILCLKSPKGESQLVFHEGFFVSANHLNNSVRIGKVLLDMNALTAEQLDQALHEQKEAGKNRKPLVATLIEQGTINKETAFKGLETLIEMTIVEVMTWSSGTFSLDVSKNLVSDEYRYFPEKLNQEILLNAQGILMDSLRIYDERMRDGTLSQIFFTEENDTENQSNAETFSGTGEITADLLGLDELDTIVRKIPDVFIGLKDHDPVHEHRQIVAKSLPEETIDQQELLVNCLSSFSSIPSPSSPPPVTSIILMTKNEMLSYGVSITCKHENLFVFTTDEEAGLDIVIEQSLNRDLHPVLVIDIPHDSVGIETLELIRQKKVLYPYISILLLSCCPSWRMIGIDALVAGAGSIIPRPCGHCLDDAYVPQMIAFLKGMGPFLSSIRPVVDQKTGQDFVTALNQLKSLTEPPQIALALLQFTSLQFERAMTFVVAKSELIAEKSIGIDKAKIEGPSSPHMFRVPLERHSVFQEVTEKGKFYYGQRLDEVLTKNLYKEIGAPRSPKVLAVPLVSRGKVIAIIYADFGAKPVSPPQINLIEAMAQHAGSVLDNALYRKSIEKTVV